MTKPAPKPSQRKRLREKARARRASLVERRESLLELAASGYATETVAARFGITPGAVRRAIAQAVAARRRDAADSFVDLQVLRLHKALRAAEAAVDRNDLRGVDRMIKIVGELDRYHRPALAAPLAELALPAQHRAPLALTHQGAPELAKAR